MSNTSKLDAYIARRVEQVTGEIRNLKKTILEEVGIDLDDLFFHDSLFENMDSAPHIEELTALTFEDLSKINPKWMNLKDLYTEEEVRKAIVHPLQIYQIMKECPFGDQGESDKYMVHGKCYFIYLDNDNTISFAELSYEHGRDCWYMSSSYDFSEGDIFLTNLPLPKGRV